MTSRLPDLDSDLTIEPSRGVYDAHRATALSGVPLRTLNYWAEKGTYRPSIVSEPHTRFWSWSDLLALRAIDWLRREKRPDGPRRVNTSKVRKAILELAQAGFERSCGRWGCRCNLLSRRAHR